MISGSQQERIKKYAMMRSQNQQVQVPASDLLEQQQQQQQLAHRRGQYCPNLQSIPTRQLDQYQMNHGLQNLRNSSPQTYQAIVENNYRASLAPRAMPLSPSTFRSVEEQNLQKQQLQAQQELAHRFSLLMRQSNDQHINFPTPSSSTIATESNSRSTVNSGWGNDFPEISQFTSRDFVARSAQRRQSPTYGNPPTPSFSYESVGSSGREDYEQLMRESKLEPRSTMAVPSPSAGVYTSDTVHHLVKTSRDPKQSRIVSNKVFVGGINHLMDRSVINQFFGQFGIVFVDWPVKAPKVNIRGKPGPVSSYSYLFLVYVDEESVHRLMEKCHNPLHNEFYVSVPGCHDKRIQIRPWFLEKGFYFHPDAAFRKVIDIHRTVFVGGLPRIVTAEEIAMIFSIFGTVLLVNIDLDQDYGYPKGAARVTFEKDSSFNAALEKKYIKFDSIDSSKTTIEIKPYVMEDVACDQCGGLWFNPILEIYTHLEEADKMRKPVKMANLKKASFCGEMEKQQYGHFDMWSYNGPLSPTATTTSPQASTMRTETDSYFDRMDLHHSNEEELKDDDFEHFRSASRGSDSEAEQLYKGSLDYLQMAQKFNLHKQKTVEFNGQQYAIGPNLWRMFVAEPNLSLFSQDVMQIPALSQLNGYLQMRRNANIYCNKSSYCKDKPCRQYYCSSCSHKLHSMRSTRPHSILPAGKPNRRPRRDKSMYLIDQ